MRRFTTHDVSKTIMSPWGQNVVNNSGIIDNTFNSVRFLEKDNENNKMQMDFSSQSAPDLRPVACAQDAVGHDEFGRDDSADSHKAAVLDREAYVPENYISPEVYALLAAAEASAARRTDDLEGAVLNMTENACALLCVAPPKRFYRTFWRSISQRLLDRSAHMA